MAFWGIELKPNTPFKHRYDFDRGRLHVSQATLGLGESKKTVYVQCEVGDRNPVLLCSLLPMKTESCLLNLEFEEDSDVVLSVVGNRSVHLTGFYLGSSGDVDHHGDDSDSYGEDIAETDTDQSSDYDSEDEYDDDFIDDDELQMFSPSHWPNSGVTIEEIIDDEKPANETATIKLRKKKHELTGSHPSQQQMIVNNSIALIVESEDEDGFPVSTGSKSKSIADKADLESKADKIIGDDFKESTEDANREGASLKRKIDSISDEECQSLSRRESQLPNSIAPSDDVAGANGGKSKKNKKQKSKDGNLPKSEERTSGEKATDVSRDGVTSNSETIVGEEKGINKDEDLPENDKQENLLNDKEVADSTVPSSNDVAEGSGKLKKKKKSKKDKTLQSAVGLSAVEEVKAENDGGKSSDGKEATFEANDGGKSSDGKEATFEAMDQVPSISTREENLLDDTNVNHDIVPTAGDSQSEGKKKRKKKNKSSHLDINTNTNTNVEGPVSATEREGNELGDKIDKKKAQVCPSKPRTFSNGLVIEELSMGKPDGKRAHPGKKVSVYYIGKLKRNGEIFDSNIGKRPFKFRLGIGQVIKGWDVGVAGMRVGDKRRLTIPPSMGYGAQGVGKIPQNAWLIFDVELVDVQ